MKKILFRFLSYGVDMLILSLIIYGLCQINFLNPHKDEIIKLNEEYLENTNQYSKLYDKVDDYIEDSILDENELLEINDNYPLYYDVVINNTDTSTLKDELYQSNLKYYNNYSYNVSKKSISQLVINIVVVVLYFGVFQYFMKGQTIGKKIFKLHVISNNDKKLNIGSYLIRSLLVGEVIFYVIKIVAILCLDYDKYFLFTNIISEINWLYECTFALFIFIRNDSKGVQDLLLKTSVVSIEKRKKEYVEAEIVNDKEFTN